MSATVELTREGVGIELRRGTFSIVVDGAEVGSIEWRETKDVPVEPGQHTLVVRAGRYSSRPRSFDAAEGETVRFRLHGAMVWPRYLASALKPDLAIALRRLE